MLLQAQGWRRCLVLAVLLLNAPLAVYAAPTLSEQDLIPDRQDRLFEEQRRRVEEPIELPGKRLTFAHFLERLTR